jgi:hypothetical protein
MTPPTNQPLARCLLSMREQGNERNNDEGSEPTKKDRIGTGLKAMACLAFLVLSLVLWLMTGRSWLVFILLLLPCYACEEWLSGKMFTERSRWSTSESGFSIFRIIYGVILTLLLFGVIYGLTVIVRWFF